MTFYGLVMVLLTSFCKTTSSIVTANQPRHQIWLWVSSLNRALETPERLLEIFLGASNEQSVSLPPS